MKNLKRFESKICLMNSSKKLVNAHFVLNVSDGRGVGTLQTALLDSFNNIKNAQSTRKFVLGAKPEGYQITGVALIDPKKADPFRKALRKFKSAQSSAVVTGAMVLLEEA